MAFNIRQITVPMGTVTGNKDITIAGFGTPKAVMCVASFTSTGLDTLSPNARQAITFTDGTDSAGDGFSSNDGVTTSATRRDSIQGHLLRVLSTGGGKLLEADFVSWITDGLRINITTVNPVPEVYVTFILMNGDDLLSAKVKTTALTGSSPLTIADLGFEPTAILTTCSGQGNLDVASSTGIFSYGISLNDGGDKNHGILWNDVNAVSTTNVDTYITDTYCVGQLTNQVLSWRAYINTYTSTGFRINWTGTAGNDAIHYLALELAPSVKIDLGLIDSPATTGVFNESGIPFQPDFLMITSGGNSALNTLNGSGAFNAFVSDGTESFSHSASSQNAVTTTNAKTRLSNDLHFIGNGSSDVEVGTFTSFNSDGYSLNMTTATSKKWMRLLIGVGGGSFTLDIDGGVYTSTGGSVDLLFNRSLSVNGGNYSTSGANINLLFNRSLNTDGGIYNTTGSPLDLLFNRQLLVDGGSYSYTGSAVTLVYNPLTGFVMDIDGGVYDMTGGQVDTLYNRVIDVDGGSYSTSGANLALLYNRSLNVDGGVYSASGGELNLLLDRVIQVDGGNYSYAGSAVGLIYSGQITLLIDCYSVEFKQDSVSISYAEDNTRVDYGCLQ